MAKPVEIEILLKDHLTAGLESARRELERLTAAGDTSSDRFRQLQSDIRSLETELDRLGDAAGNTRVLPAGLPQAQRQFNGLHNSIQQMAREMPSLAMGPQMFFMAISNNLPIFTDELARARQEYQALAATGQKATPVWRQVLSSLFSWQTALTTGIMLLVMYGDEIANWVGSLFRAKDGTSELEAATKRLNEAVSGVYGSISEEMRNLRSLNEALQTAKRGTEEWESIRNKIVTDYSKYLPSLDSEIEKTGTLAGSYDRLAESIQRAAAARGFEEYSKKEDEKYIEERNKQLQRVYDAFTDQLGDEEGLKMYQEWLRQLDSGMRPSRQMQNRFGQVGVGFGLGNANSVLIDLQNLQRAHDESIEEYRRIFNLSEGAESGLPSDSIKAMRDSIAARREALEQLSTASKEYARLKAEIEADEQRLSRLTGNAIRANAATGQQNRLGELEQQQAQARIRQQTDLENQVAQADIDAMADGAEKKRAQRELDNRKELQGIERQKQEYIQSVIQAQKEIFDAQEESKAKQNPNYQKKLFDSSSVSVDTSQFDLLLSLTQSRQLSDKWQADEQAMNEYYQKYGTFLQRREALEKQYRQKITEAGGADTWQGKALQKQLEEALADLDLEQLKEQIDWERVFGDLGSLSADGLQRVKEQLKEFIRAQQDLSPESIEEVVDALERIGDEQAERDPFGSLSRSLSTLDEATRRVHEAQQEYNRALEEGTAEEQRNAKAALSAARDERQRARQEAADSLHAATEEAQQYMAAASGLADIVSQLGIEPPGWLSDYLAGADRMLGGLSQIDLTRPASILTGGLEALGGMLQSITSLGGLVNWNGSNAEEVRSAIERLTDRNEALQGSIDALNDTIRQGRGTQSVQAARQAAQYQQEVNRNYLEMAMAQAGYHGSRHSWNYYWEGFSQEQIDRLSQQIGRQWSGNLWDLSPEEMQRLKGNVDMWQLIGDTGKGGYGHRLQEQLDQYIAQAGQLEEITGSLYESLTQISFDSMYDSFVDSLMDMEFSAEDAADNISEYFMRAMLSNKIGELYYDKLEQWWQDFGRAMENDGTLSGSERQSLMDRYMQYVDEALNLRDQLAAATGYTGSSSGSGQTGRAGSFNAMSQEQGTKLEGLFTSGQMHWASMDGLMQDAVTQMSAAIDRLRSIEEHTGDSARHLAEIKEDIRKREFDIRIEIIHLKIRNIAIKALNL